jgi:hypothetical protein
MSVIANVHCGIRRHGLSGDIQETYIPRAPLPRWRFAPKSSQRAEVLNKGTRSFHIWVDYVAEFAIEERFMINGVLQNNMRRGIPRNLSDTHV